MARFGSTVAFVVNHKRYQAGTTYADTPANAIGNDVVWVGLSTSSMAPGLVPLDGTATTMKGASRFANTPIPTIDGANSIRS
jgi:hypothetical protein